MGRPEAMPTRTGGGDQSGTEEFRERKTKKREKKREK